MTKKYLTEEQIQEICQRYQEGESASSISKSFKVSISTVLYHCKKSLESLPAPQVAPLPSGYSDINAAYCDYCACLSMGFESDFAVALCRSKNVNLIELKNFGEWAKKNLTLTDKQDLKRQKDLLDELRLQKKGLGETNQRTEAALAEYGRQQLENELRVREKEQELARARKELQESKEEIALLKKLRAILEK